MEAGLKQNVTMNRPPEPPAHDVRRESPAFYRLCVAPMMAWTDRHCRMFHRLLAPSARLYTEMASTDALLFGSAAKLLAFDAAEHPVALQLGGSDPADLARCARLGAAAGFDEVNLNVGCPSERVRRGMIGACLMREPGRVAACVAAMRDAVSVPVTVKCRLGVADSAADAASSAPQRDYGALRDFVGQVAQAGCAVFLVHARKAVLGGLTPAQNRAVPPLRPELAERLKRDFPELAIIVNGGIRSTEAAQRHLRWADGVMVGRGAYRDPIWLSNLHAALCGGPALAPHAALDAYLPYAQAQLRRGARLHDMTRHLMTVFNGLPGARRYRRRLSERDGAPGAGIDVLLRAAAEVAGCAQRRQAAWERAA